MMRNKIVAMGKFYALQANFEWILALLPLNTSIIKCKCLMATTLTVVLWALTSPATTLAVVGTHANDIKIIASFPCEYTMNWLSVQAKTSMNLVLITDALINYVHVYAGEYYTVLIAIQGQG